MYSFVLDCSITMAWCFEDEAFDYTDAVLDSLKDAKALVPNLWQLEVADVLLMAERHKRIHEADMLRFVYLLNQLPIDMDTNPAIMNNIVLLGGQHQLTSYDTAYLHLALTHGLPLATKDEKLKLAMQQAGAKLFNP